MAARANSGPFPFPTQSDWAEDLYEAIVASCEVEGVTPAPRRAVLQALAPALGAGEAKRIIERRRDGTKFLKPSAYHVDRRGTDNALLLLNVALHGAATLPWPLNDRTRSDWLHPTDDNTARLEDFVTQEQVVVSAKANLQRARGAQRGLSSAASSAEKDAAVAAVKAAEDGLQQAEGDLASRQSALGNRRPLPVIRTATENGEPVAALTTAPTTSAVARSVQQYAVECLRKRNRSRSYDLRESLALEGQREATVVVLQQVPIIHTADGRSEIWRPFQVTGNNRADGRLQLFGIDAAELLTGIPQTKLLLPGEETNPRLLLVGLGEILRRVSTRLNEEYADPERDRDQGAEHASRVAEVPARVVVGAGRPERLEVVLRELNVHDHLRGQLVYDSVDRGLGIFSTLVQAYQEKNLLADLMAEYITYGRVAAGELDAAGIADALVGAGPLDPLAALLQPGESVSQLTLRDMAIRCVTLLIFPPIPAPPEKLAPYSRMPTGRYWPVVRTTMQEAAWSQDNSPKARRRTEVWAAAVGQLFVYRGNLLATEGTFTAANVQYGVRPDRRSLSTLVAACRNGDKEAWDVLVRRHLVPGLVNAPEAFVTAGQGSETGADRKGVRRPPTNAVKALIEAFSTPPDGVTRALLLSFADSVLRAPDATTGVDDRRPGTFWAPDENGDPQIGQLADKAWYDALLPKVTTGRRKQPDPGELTDPGEMEDESGSEFHETPEDIPEDAFTRMTRLRGEVPGQIDRCQRTAASLVDELKALGDLIKEAVAAREECDAQQQPSQAQKAFADDLKAARDEIESHFRETRLAVMEL